jgi:hypothetical protein
MAGVGGHPLGVATATQVGRHDSEATRQLGCHLVPHRMRLRMAVQQQQRRAVAAAPDCQAHARVCDDIGAVEALEH